MYVMKTVIKIYNFIIKGGGIILLLSQAQAIAKTFPNPAGSSPETSLESISPITTNPSSDKANEFTLKPNSDSVGIQGNNAILYIKNRPYIDANGKFAFKSTFNTGNSHINLSNSILVTNIVFKGISEFDFKGSYKDIVEDNALKPFLEGYSFIGSFLFRGGNNTIKFQDNAKANGYIFSFSFENNSSSTANFYFDNSSIENNGQAIVDLWGNTTNGTFTNKSKGIGDLQFHNGKNKITIEKGSSIIGDFIASGGSNTINISDKSSIKDIKLDNGTNILNASNNSILGNFIANGGSNTINISDKSSIKDITTNNGTNILNASNNSILGNFIANGGKTTINLGTNSSMNNINLNNGNSTITLMTQTKVKNIEINGGTFELNTSGSPFIEKLGISGGVNTLNITDTLLNPSTLKSGVVTIDGGKNTLNITGNSVLKDINISISRQIFKKNNAPVGAICNPSDLLCYIEPDNTFNFTDAKSIGGKITIIGGTSNNFTFTNSSSKNNDIVIIGGEANNLNFIDSSKIEGKLTINGGKENQISFKNTTLSPTTSAFITPDTQGNLISKAILSNQMTPEFVAKILNIQPDLNKGDITLQASIANDTKNTIKFSNGTIAGDILIQQSFKATTNVINNIDFNKTLFIGNIKSNGKGILTTNNFLDSSIVGNIITNNGINHTTLSNSQFYGDMITTGGVNIASFNAGSIFAGSMTTYNGKNFIDLNMSLYTNQYGKISKINTYNGVSNITLSINETISKMLTDQGIYPVFHIGNYNGGTSNIGIYGPVSGYAQIDYDGGTSNIIFADGGNANDTKNFFTNLSTCNTDSISQDCLKSGEAVLEPSLEDASKANFKINGYTYKNGIAFKLDAVKANEVLQPFRDIYPDNFVSIFIDKTNTKNSIYQMKIDGIIVGAEYNLPVDITDKKNIKYEVSLTSNSAFIGNMYATTENTDFILSQGSKLVLYDGSHSVISTLTSTNGTFKVNTDTMFKSTLAQKNNVIIDLATRGELVNNTFMKDKFSTMIIKQIDNFNDGIFRVAINPNKTDPANSYLTESKNSDRIIIQGIATGQNLTNYIQVYQDYTSLRTGDLSKNNILVAAVKFPDMSDKNASMEFDTSASRVQQGYDEVNTILYTKKIELNNDGSININPTKDKENAEGYFIKSASTAINPNNLDNTNNAITSNYSIYLANINNLNKRLGELRDNSYAQGVWSRVFSGLNTSNRGETAKIYSTNVQLGYDYGWKTYSGQQFLGTAFTYGYNSIKGQSYNGSANLAEAAIYYSYVNDSGFYTDTIAKYTYIRNNISLKNNVFYNVPLNSNGGSLGQEVGYRYFIDKKKSFYAEPSGEIILGLMSGGVINQVNQSALLDYKPEYTPKLSADLTYILSFRAKLGGSIGYDLVSGKNQTSFRLGAFYLADVVNGGVVNYKTNYSKGQTLLYPNQQMMINLGLNSIISENWRFYADIDTGFFGKYFNQNYLVSVGMRYEFGHALNPKSAKLAQDKKIASIKTSQARYDEQIAKIQTRQEKIKQKQAFETKKAQILATKKAEEKSRKTNIKEADKTTKNQFKILALEIVKSLKDEPSMDKVKAINSQEIEIFQAYEDRKNKEFAQNSIIELNTLEEKQTQEYQNLQQKQNKALQDLEEKYKSSKDVKAANKKAKEAKGLKIKQEKQNKELKSKQNKEKKLLLQDQSKENKTLQNNIQEQYDKLIDKQHKDILKTQDLEKSFILDKFETEVKKSNHTKPSVDNIKAINAQELTIFENFQKRSIEVIKENHNIAIKNLQQKQNKALQDLEEKYKSSKDVKAANKKAKEAKELKIKQEKQNKELKSKQNKEIQTIENTNKKDLEKLIKIQKQRIQETKNLENKTKTKK